MITMADGTLQILLILFLFFMNAGIILVAVLVAKQNGKVVESVGTMVKDELALLADRLRKTPQFKPQEPNGTAAQMTARAQADELIKRITEA